MHRSVPRDGLTLPAVALSSYGTGVLYAIGAGVALGTLGPVSNIAYAAGMGSPTFAAMRATIGALVLLAFAGRAERRVSLRSLSRREQGTFALTAAAQACLSLALFAAYGAMTVALVLAVYFSTPCSSPARRSPSGASGSRPHGSRRWAWRSQGCSSSCSGGWVRTPTCRSPGSRSRRSRRAARRRTSSRPATASRGAVTQAVTVILAGAALAIWAVALPVDGVSGRLTAWVAEPSAWLAILFAGAVGAGLAKVLAAQGRAPCRRHAIVRAHARRAPDRRPARRVPARPADRAAGARRAGRASSSARSSPSGPRPRRRRAPTAAA